MVILILLFFSTLEVVRLYTSIFSKKKSVKFCFNLFEHLFSWSYQLSFLWLAYSCFLPTHSHCKFGLILTRGSIGFFCRILGFQRFYYLFLERGEGRVKERNINVWLPLLCPHAGLQPRHVPWLGIDPVTLWFTGQQSIHWATQARASVEF